MNNTLPPAQPRRIPTPPGYPTGMPSQGRHPYGPPRYGAGAQPGGPRPPHPPTPYYRTAPPATAYPLPVGAPMPPRPAPAVKTGPRVGMIIVGIVIALIGAWIIAASSGFMVDEQLALILILALGGLTLIVSALIAAWRRPKA